MLVGDSAGMVLPSNGAGITIAMIGGRIAGQVIAENISKGTPLEEYEIRWKKHSNLKCQMSLSLKPNLFFSTHTRHAHAREHS